jgi:hypothetical protein
MRKFTVILPLFAILLAAAVLTSELGALSAQSPTPATTTPDAVEGTGYVADDGDISAATWVETGVKNQDTRKSRIPPPKTTVNKKKKKN